MVTSKDLSITAASAILSVDMPEGTYKLIGWEMYTTGHSLDDDMCQIGAFTTHSTFSHYIMPLGELNPFAQRRYNLQVITVSRYRMLKNLKTNKFLITRSEFSVLNDFISWLENNRGSSTDGVILVYHEVKKMAPLILLYALKRYGMYERFSAVVKGFCNIYPLAETKCPCTIKTVSLKALTKSLLQRNVVFKSALDRAKASFGIILHLAKYERPRYPFDRALDASVNESYAVELARPFTRPIESEISDLMYLKNLIDRQNTFYPVLRDILKYDWMSRQSAIRIRRKLVEHNMELEHLETVWNYGGRRALQILLKSVSNATQREQDDMLIMFDCYFDPSKEAVTGNFFRLRRQRENLRWISENEWDPYSDSTSRSLSDGSTISFRSVY